MRFDTGGNAPQPRVGLMSNKILALLTALALNMTATADNTMRIGDGQIDGARLEPYRHTWYQCALQDGQWRDQGKITEEFVAIGDLVIRHRQTAQQPNGVISRSDTFFDRASFAPLRMEMEATLDGERVAYAERELTRDGYTGVLTRGGSTRDLQGDISSDMLHGGAMGLPLATIAYQDEPLQFQASMIGFDATYDVIAEWVGMELLVFGDQEIDAWMIDVEWHHREIGDVYPPGPDASGGRYWVVPEPPAGFPYVPRYKTDSYAVEFIRETCREAN